MRDRKRMSRTMKRCVGIPMAVLTAVAALGLGGCSWDSDDYNTFIDNNVVTPCPPRMFAYDIDTVANEPYLCMLDEEDITSGGVANCVPCDFKMNRIDDGNYVYLATNNNGNYIYSNKDETETNDDRKFLTEETSKYIINKYSDYKKYVEDDNELKLYAIGTGDGCTVDTPENCEGKQDLEGYKKAFEYNLCLRQYPVCSFGDYDNQGKMKFYCTPKGGADCGKGQHFDNQSQTCKTDDIYNCGSTGYDCTKNVAQWKDGDCTDGVCLVTECKTGYKPVTDQTSCASDCVVGQHYDNGAQACVDDDVFNCGNTGYICSENVDQWADGSCINGVCTLLQCENGYKIDNNTCKSDCKVGEPGELGEHYDSEQAKCVPNDIDNCGATGNACKDEIKNSSEVKCENGKCIVIACNSGYTINNNVCTSSCTNTEYYDSVTGTCKTSDINNCGMKGYACSEKVDLWKDGSCDNNVCTVTVCRTGFKVVANVCKADCGSEQHYNTSTSQCEDNDINNCGAVGYKCSERVAQWSDGACVSGVCTLSKCESGYKIVNNACKSDCKVGEHYDSDQAKCVGDDNNNCGATGHKCTDEILNSATVHCTSGKCYVDKCNSGYTVNNNVCTSSCTNKQYYDSSTGTCATSGNNNCGQKGYKCSEHISNWKSGNCTNNVCVVGTCNDGYVVVNNECKADCGTTKYYDSSTGACVASDINSCGMKGYKCASQVANWSAGTCSNNVCIVTECATGYKPSSDGKSCVSNCSTGQHYDNTAQKCVNDDIDNCGSTGHKCIDEIKNSQTVSCEKGKCKVSACNAGYSVNNNVCTSSCTSSQYYNSTTGACANSNTDNCGQMGYKCSAHISNWATGNCTSNACKVSTCVNGYTVVNNECKADCGTTKYYDSSTGACVASDVNSCGMKDYKCATQVANWSNGTCSNNVCIATSCATGYKPSSDGKSCVSDCSDTQYYDSEQAKCVDSSVTNCGQKGYKCSDKILNWSNGTCTKNVCKVTSCNQGYTVKNNACVSSCSSSTQYYDSSTGACATSDTNNCGQKGYKCSAHISNWSNGACTGNACIVSECASGYAVVGNECKADCGKTKYYDSATGACVNSDVNNCGQKGFKCSQNVSHWSNGTCSNNVCIATSCATGYKPSSDGKSCVSDCSDTQYYDSATATCQNSDVNNCGQKGYKCSDKILNWSNGTCTENVCKVTSCNQGYTVKNNACVSSCSSSTQYYDSSTGACATSDTNNCGQKGYKCSAHISNWSNGACTGNACIVSECASGYAVVGNECKADCGKTKYYDSSTGACVNSDVNNCGQKEFKCSQNVSHWSNGSCSDNVCIATSCATGYKPSSDGKSCVSDCSDTQYYDSATASCQNSDVNNCGQKGYKCSDKILNWSNGTCTENVCKVTSCNQGYTVKNNACVSSCSSSTQYYDSSTGACATSDTNNCGQKGYKCSAHISNWSNGACTGNACIVSECASGYAVVGNECKADCGTTKYYDSSTGACVNSDVNNCGQKGYKCFENTAGWDSNTKGTCTNNKCVATGDCISGYHLTDGKCIPDTNSCCGSGCINCTSSGKSCISGACEKTCETNTYSCTGIPGCLTAFALSSSYHMNTDCSCKDGYADTNLNMEDGCEDPGT